MSEIGSERSKSWNIYTTPDQSPSAQTDFGQEAPWKNFGSSMNAISFGFVATAILISMFLIMAIFEHLFRPTSPLSSSSDEVTNNSAGSGPAEKFACPNMVSRSYASDFSVLMPGQHIPTFIAQPAPLPVPCQREGIYWPSHDHNFSGP
ncbi:uncharacterized protein LOC111008157 isoform X1 [Momordica charantia]|uniref:Uncharacterized protein LOC111008157 isoform X1 n=1 Tax=Momordica charantia TaxID=3673 RepID=A0A6J1C5I8_MOMCH|nr:uncharacterized protein LOC111008157 isoform X1 [Momordica charantia]XP_022136448.1 uncharacterized protein LOC111008157 isoform X1 [Momordica charantia]XP_022136449.1 uncharacterized protein LOC111008157 isoform X1 [Momordica charantia]XP_022136450.1 uncharacterized protein LOC111008157 isoform X1 [Momordica charantia]